MARHWQAKNTAAGVEDMVLLRQLTDEAIVENLRRRLAARAMFTYIGPVLVSVNPFTQVAKFDEHEMEQYQGAAQYENAPHIFALADAMFRNVLIDRERQCVIVSGESGAGKTVCAKHIMSYLTFSSGGGQRVQRVKGTLLQSNPLLEAFGNAATLRNWNSSRFGKYVEIVFGVSGEPLGGRISSFLLEKSRVVQTALGERNFHIFYQMLAGADAQLRQSLGLSTPDYFNYLNCSECFQAEGTDDQGAFAETLNAMNMVGLDDQLQLQCLTVVAATLHIGNITFVENDKDGFASVADEKYLQFPAFLLGLTAEDIKEKLTRRQLHSGAKREQVEVRLNQDQAAYTRNAWAKALYDRLFEFIVASVNCALDVDTRRHSIDLSVGVLDIYGFEVFERNGFEQFCINFVNEKLQQIFIELTLKAEQDEYQSEGIQWTPIEFFNNKIVCDLIEAKRPSPGIMSVLDDICVQRHGQSEGADKEMLATLTQHLQGHEHFRPGAGCFIVRHYAGEVLYQIDGFCDRNRDILHADLVQLMLGSEHQFMRQLFVDCVSKDPNKKPTTASTKIRSQCNHLMDSLMRCVPHYVRCIKPNERKRALEFNEQRVLHQVRYLGLCENIRVRRAGFVYRRAFERFLWRYAILCTETWPRWHGEARKGCELICRSSELVETEFRLGHSKIFIRNPESLFLLEEARERKFDGFARVLQRAFRRFTAKRHLLKQKDEAISLLRGRKERCRFSLERRFVGGGAGRVPIEGIQWTPIEFFNNKIVCDLIEAKRPSPGIMSVLDDICVQRHGQSEGADKEMLATLTQHLQGHEHFRPGAGCFIVRHYAGEVLYQIDGFCDRNRDILHADLVQLMLGSEHQFMRQLFVDCVSKDPNKKPTTASTKIRSQCNHLMDSLMRCVPHYVRCIKPNERKRALEFNEQRVLHQVRYLGLCENIRVRRAGFVYRRAFERFLWRYAILCTETWPRWHGEARKGCELICRSSELVETEFRLGHSKIFIRNPESLFLLEEARERKFDGFARVLQRAFRRFTAKKHLLKQKDEAISLLRGRKERCRFSLERRFVGDYIGMEQRPGLQAIIGRRERLHFAASVVKYDRRFRTTRTDLLLTAKYLFLVGREPLKSGVNKGKLVEVVKRQILLTQLRAVSVSTLQDDFVLISVADSHCSLVETPLKTELLAALYKRCKERVGCPPLPLEFRDRFVVHLKAHSTFPLALRLIDGVERFVEFQLASGGGGIIGNQAAKTQLKTNGRLMVVTVLKGLSPESKPTGQRHSVDIQQQMAPNGQRHHQKSVQQTLQLPPHHLKDEQQQQKHLATTNGVIPQAQHALAKVLQQRPTQQKQQQRAHQQTEHRPAPQKPPPLKPKPQVKPTGPMLRTLYAYEAQDTDELSFVKDQLIELVKKDDSGWWQGRLDGRTGLFPANYVSET
uniref:Unconventional myosin-Ie n=1 Tax=Globodera pallida TaxID=36090 RepID=A0A183BVL5_GLOPA